MIHAYSVKQRVAAYFVVIQPELMYMFGLEVLAFRKHCSISAFDTNLVNVLKIEIVQ